MNVDNARVYVVSEKERLSSLNYGELLAVKNYKKEKFLSKYASKNGNLIAFGVNCVIPENFSERLQQACCLREIVSLADMISSRNVENQQGRSR